MTPKEQKQMWTTKLVEREKILQSMTMDEMRMMTRAKMIGHEWLTERKVGSRETKQTRRG
jgi:hypothetical protein